MAELLSRWREGLSKTSKSAFGRLADLLGTSEIRKETWDDLESLLIQADIGLETTTEVITGLKSLVRELGLTHADELRNALRVELRKRLITPSPLEWPAESVEPTVILIVGVNGSGKTTTIAKL